MRSMHPDQRHLAACLDRLAEALRHAARERAPADLPDVPWPRDAEAPALERLAQRFGLSRFERDVVLLAAAPALDPRFGALIAELPGADGRAPTPRTAMAALPGASWAAFSPAGALRRDELVRIEAGPDPMGARLGCDERVWQHLLGIHGLDPRVARHVRPLGDDAPLLHSQISAARALAETWRRLSARGPAPALRLEGRSSMTAARIVAAAAAELGLELIRIPAESLLAEGELDLLVRLWHRERGLHPRALLVDAHGLDSGDPARSGQLARLLDDLGGFVAVCGWAHPVSGALPSPCMRLVSPRFEEARARWQLLLEELGERGARAGQVAEDLAGRFDLDPHAMRAAVALAEVSLALGEERSVERALWDACREVARPAMAELAQRIPTRATWDDLVLPQGLLTQLRGVEACVRLQHQVNDTWGLGRGSERGRGVAVLMAGPSGTGKTLSAEVLAGALRLDLYRVDLATVSSKYIGDTEKNLRRIFDAAESGSAVLLFDEADALFGRRGEVSAGHDRYANLEVSYLLQRMESFSGLALMTTNLKENIDQAFLRRFRFILDYPFPDQAQREAMWRRVYPASTPTQGLDPRRLSQLAVSNAAIESIAWMAASLAAAEGAPVRMRHLLVAARWECQKTQKLIAPGEVAGWGDGS